MSIRMWLAGSAAWLCVVSVPVHAQEARTVYLQAGGGEDRVYNATVGVTLPWQRLAWDVGGGVVRGHWDWYVSNWSSRAMGEGRHNLAVLGVVPSLRWRGDQGKSPWFVEVGTGVSVSDGHYRSAGKTFSTRFNFASHIGIGRNFGSRSEHELSLRLQHSSNAGIKRPNPGENLVLLRYAHTF